MVVGTHPLQLTLMCMYLCACMCTATHTHTHKHTHRFTHTGYVHVKPLLPLAFWNHYCPSVHGSPCRFTCLSRLSLLRCPRSESPRRKCLFSYSATSYRKAPWEVVEPCIIHTTPSLHGPQRQPVSLLLTTSSLGNHSPLGIVLLHNAPLIHFEWTLCFFFFQSDVFAEHSFSPCEEKTANRSKCGMFSLKGSALNSSSGHLKWESHFLCKLIKFQSWVIHTTWEWQFTTRQ